jgi:hypothetical protein
MRFVLLSICIAVVVIAVVLAVRGTASVPSSGKTAPLPENELNWLNPG